MGKGVCCQIQPTIAFVFSHSVVSDSCDPMDCSPPGPSCPWDPPGKNTGVGCHFHLQGIFPTQGWTRSPLHLLPWHVSALPLWGPGVSPLFFFFPTFWACHTACGILASPTKSIEPRPPRVKVQTFNLWTTREVPPLGNFSDWFPRLVSSAFSSCVLCNHTGVPTGCGGGGTCLFQCIESS